MNTDQILDYLTDHPEIDFVEFFQKNWQIPSLEHGVYSFNPFPEARKIRKFFEDKS